jgi:hypothetical protein
MAITVSQARSFRHLFEKNDLQCEACDTSNNTFQISGNKSATGSTN